MSKEHKKSWRKWECAMLISSFFMLLHVRNRKHVVSVYWVLVEFHQYTNANAAIWLAELLVHYQPLEYSHCRSSKKCDVFIVSRSFRRKFRCKRVVIFLRRLKQAHLRFLAFKSLKIMKERVRAQTTANLPDTVQFLRLCLQVKFNNSWQSNCKPVHLR